MVSGTVQTLGKSRVYVRPPDARVVTAESDASDFIGETYGLDVEWVAIPLDHLAPDFFRLRNGVAGAFIQKLITYGLKVAFVGDVSNHAASSEPLRAFIAESNRGGQVWFVADFAELEQRLS